jgi:hypothetical protein
MPTANTIVKIPADQFIPTENLSIEHTILIQLDVYSTYHLFSLLTYRT